MSFNPVDESYPPDVDGAEGFQIERVFMNDDGNIYAVRFWDRGSRFEVRRMFDDPNMILRQLIETSTLGWVLLEQVDNVALHLAGSYGI